MGFEDAHLSIIEVQELTKLSNILQNVHPIRDSTNEFGWWCNAGGFSIKSSFKRTKELSNFCVEMNDILLRDPEVLSKTKIQRKIQIFGWTLI